MAGIFGLKSNRVRRELERKFGFSRVRPVLNETGQEEFGLIELAPEYGLELFAGASRKPKADRRPYLSAGLRLVGPQLNLFLGDDKHEQNFWSSLCAALPSDSPCQVLLRRRRGELGPHYQSWQNKAQERLTDPEVGFFFLQDYLENVIYPVEESGIAHLWAGIFISGRDEAELARRLTRIAEALPCASVFCSSDELSLLLMDYFAPSLLESGLSQEELKPQLLAKAGLEIGETEVENGNSLSFWTLSAPPPQVEGGWTRPLLESEALADSEFDIVVHLAPTPSSENLQAVISRRIASLELSIAQARANGDKRLVRELAQQRLEVGQRLEAMADGSESYYELGVSLALRSLPDSGELEAKIEQETAIFKTELSELGMSPRRVIGLENMQRALLTCAPLNLGRMARSFILPSQAAGRLAQVASEGQIEVDPTLPLVGLTPGGEPLFLNPAARPGESSLFFVGNPGKGSALPARALVEYLAGMRYIDGTAIFGFDPAGDWVGAVRQLGGTYVALGPNQKLDFGWNPLCLAPEHLNNLTTLEKWINQVAAYLEKLLELNPLERQDLNAVLLECAIEAMERGIEIQAGLLYERAQAGGYRLLAERLSDIKPGGSYHWLFARPTSLPVPGLTDDLLFIGFSEVALQELNPEARSFYLAQFFAAWVGQLAKIPRQYAPPLLLVLDEAQEILAWPEAASNLLWLSRQALPLKLSFWAISPRCDEWLTSACGQKLLDASTWQFFFSQNGAGLAGVARRLALPQRTLRAIRELGSGAAILRHATGALIELVPLPGDYVARFMPAKPRKQIAPAAAMAGRTAATDKTGTFTTSKPAAEVPTRPLVPEPLPITALEKVEAATKETASTEGKEQEPVYIFSVARGA